MAVPQKLLDVSAKILVYDHFPTFDQGPYCDVISKNSARFEHVEDICHRDMG